MATVPWQVTEGGVELAVRVTPGAGADRIEGVTEWNGLPCLGVPFSAPPVEGAANEALVAFLARALALPRSGVILVASDRTRLKRLRVTGTDVEALLDDLVAAGGRR